MSTDSLLKKMVFERLDEHLPFFRFKYDSNVFCYSKFPESLHLFTINKGSSVFRTSNSSQASRDGSVVCDFLSSLRGGRMR